ncbi:MAG: sigma-70 family RNA polymerase sigma factor [bacterium]|nr:sigma-70 family RNA polymerase sigma factor [bacterium]
MSLAVELSDDQTQLFTEQYNNYYPVVFSSIYSKIGNFDEAEDICQEVFLRFYKKINEVENPRKWLFGALRIVVLDFFKEKSRKDLDIENLFEDVSMSFVNGFRDTRLIIEDALDAIYTPGDKDGEKERVLFDLIAVHNFSYVQVSKQLNLTYKQVRYKFEMAVKKITDYLSKKGIKSLEDLL